MDSKVVFADMALSCIFDDFRFCFVCLFCSFFFKSGDDGRLSRKAEALHMALTCLLKEFQGEYNMS